MTLDNLLALPFCAADCEVLKHLYDWNAAVPGVLEPLSDLRNRVAINDVKAYLDEKKSRPGSHREREIKNATRLS